MMLDRKRLRNEPELIREAIEAKKEKADINAWLAADNDKRNLMLKIEDLRKERNRLSKEVSVKKRNGEDAEEEMILSRQTGELLSELENKLSAITETITALELSFPNIPDSDVPRGGEENNTEVAREGVLPQFSFQPKPHWELMDKTFLPADAAMISGSNFILFRDWAAKLQRVLINWMLDYNSSRGMEEIWSPFLANRDSMTATAQLPKMEDDMYRIQSGDFYLIPTGEVPITNTCRGALIPEKDLPLKLCGYTPCFRREAGSYGRDTRGLNRVHQFDKVEMVRFEHPDRSDDAHMEMVDHVRGMLSLLELPYRVLLLATGDLSFAAARCYDLEIWSAGQQKWLEVSSISNFRDFQARRGNMRFKPAEGGKPRFLHTLNGSALALPRLVAALVENGQQANGSIKLPAVIAERMGTDILQQPEN